MREQIEEYVISLYRDIPVSVYEGLLSVLCLGLVVIIACYGLKRSWRKIVGLLLVEYVFLIYCSTVFFRSKNDSQKYNFTPLWSYAASSDCSILSPDKLMNILVFVPVGCLMTISFRSVKWWQVLCIGCFISVLIEALQYFFYRGFAETDDVMHNMLGCVAGYILVQGFKQMVNGCKAYGKNEQSLGKGAYNDSNGRP